MATSINILGKVDNAQLITNNLLKIPMNEAVTITDEDYIKFKKELDTKNPSLVEKKRDDDFQKAFKELWPNTYSRLNEKEISSVSLLEELQRQKCLYNSILANDLKNCKANILDPGAKKIICKDCNELAYITPFNNLASSNVCKHSCCNTNIQYVPVPSCTHTHTHTCVSTQPTVNYMPKPVINTSDIHYVKLPNLVSGYDLPYLTAKEKEDLVKSSYNKDKVTDEVKLIESLKADNEKLRLKNKIEKTNDLVDDIINKANVIQADLKKKSAEIQIKEDMLKLKEEYYKLKREPSLKSILIKHRPRSKSPSPCTHIHDRSCSAANKRSKTPSKNRNHHHHYYDNKYTSAASSISDFDIDDIKHNRYWKTWKDVPPRVDTWSLDWNRY